MALIGANELKRKMLITVDGQPYLVTGAVQEKSFKASEKFAEPDVQLTPASFLYADGDGLHFMDETSFEQFTLDDEQIGEARGYLKEGASAQVLKYNGAPVSLELPQFVELIVTHA